MLKTHLEIFDKERVDIFYKLIHFKRFGYLAGGTALALQIKHRQSFDFDIFVNKPITNFLRLKARSVFGPVKYSINTSDQISFKTKNNINITFVWYYYDPIKPLIKTESINLASVEDIAADKAHTIGRRAVWRDYVDFYFLLKDNYYDIKKVISLAEKKFKGEFVSSLFLEQLSYTKDLRVVPIKTFKENPSSSQIKSFLENQARKYVKSVLG